MGHQQISIGGLPWGGGGSSISQKKNPLRKLILFALPGNTKDSNNLDSSGTVETCFLKTECTGCLSLYFNMHVYCGGSGGFGGPSLGPFLLFYFPGQSQ